jgi:hypothetical protein
LTIEAFTLLTGSSRNFFQHNGVSVFFMVQRLGKLELAGTASSVRAHEISAFGKCVDLRAIFHSRTSSQRLAQ